MLRLLAVKYSIHASCAMTRSMYTNRDAKLKEWHLKKYKNYDVFIVNKFNSLRRNVPNVILNLVNTPVLSADCTKTTLTRLMIFFTV